MKTTEWGNSADTKKHRMKGELIRIAYQYLIALSINYALSLSFPSLPLCIFYCDLLILYYIMYGLNKNINNKNNKKKKENKGKKC